MREIKFRVWDEKYRCWDWHMFMGYPEQPLLYQGRIFLQFTGLTDKNGREIYEGDIVRGFDFTAEIVWEKENSAFQVKSKTGSAFMSWLYMQNFEVIGNIFTTPQLLK